ncbi:MAG: SPOR domain-containing protein [Thermodesulfobacteriota bacterium]
MNQKNKPGNFQTLLFFVGFILLFFLVFALGVIVGKGLTDFESLLSKNKRGQFLASSVKSLFSDKEPENREVKDTNTNSAEKSETEVVQVLATNNEINQEKQEAITIIEEVLEKEEIKVEEKNIEVNPKKKEIKVEETKLEIKSDNIDEKVTEKKTVSEDIVTSPGKEDKNNYVAKIDYSIPEFPKTDPGGKYTVQLGSFQNIDTAYKLEKSLNEKGYPSFVVKAVIPEKGTWYRVRVGTFNNKDKASDYAEKIKNKEKLEFTQITLNN